MKLESEPRYETTQSHPSGCSGLLYAILPCMCLAHFIAPPLRTILQRQDLHSRLVNGSDYPLPAINFLILIRPLLRNGYINAEHATLLREIYRANPLVFDFVLKRIMVAPGTRMHFADSVFQAHPALEHVSHAQSS